MRVWISALVLGLWVSYITFIYLISLLYSEDRNVKVKVMMEVKTISRNHSYIVKPFAIYWMSTLAE